MRVFAFPIKYHHLRRLELCFRENKGLNFVQFRHSVLPCSSFLTSEDSCCDIPPPCSKLLWAENEKQNCYTVSELGSGHSLERKYSFSRNWCVEKDLMKRISSLLSKRGWNLDLTNVLLIELDESNVTRILNDLYDESLDAALAFYFFRFSQRFNGSKPGLQSVCTMIHISIFGNMNHVAVNLLRHIVTNADGGEGWHDLVFYLLRETSRDRKVLETVYSMLVNCFVGEGMIDMALKLIDSMKMLNFFPTIGVYNTLLGVLIELKELKLAWEICREILGRGMGLNASTLSLFIREWCLQGNFAHVCKLLFEMQNYGCKADIVAFTIVIDSLCKRGLLKEATALLYKMIETGISPDSVLLASVVDGYCKAGWLVQAVGLLDLLNCAPDIFMYNSFISKLCRDKNMVEATELFIEMSELGMDPDCFNYTTVIGGYCKVCKIDQALKTFAQMLKRGIKPAVLTYTVLIEGYCQIGDLHGAEYLFSAMKSECLRPDIVTYNALINGYCKKGHLHKAYEQMDMMRMDGVSTDVATYNILIHGLIKRGFVMESKEIFDELVRRGFSPDKFTITNIIDRCSKEGNLEEAYLIWCHMSTAGMKPDVVTCSALLNGFCKVQRIHEAKSLFHKMLDAGLEPDLILYNTLIHGFRREGNVNEALQLLNMMAENGIIPNGVTYSALVHCLEKRGVENAAEIVALKIQQIYLKNGIVVDESQYAGTCA